MADDFVMLRSGQPSIGALRAAQWIAAIDRRS